MTTPVVVTVADWVMVAANIVNEVNGVAPPTMPDKEAIPPVPPFRVKAAAPSMVEEKVILFPPPLPFVVFNVEALEKIEGPSIPIADPLVVIFPPILIAADPVKLTAPVVCTLEFWVIVAPKMVNDVNDVAPDKVMFPPVPPFKVRVTVPFNVEEKLISAPEVAPLFVVSIEVALRLTGPLQLTLPPLVLIFPFTLIRVEPV